MRGSWILAVASGLIAAACASGGNGPATPTPSASPVEHAVTSSSATAEPQIAQRPPVTPGDPADGVQVSAPGEGPEPTPVPAAGPVPSDAIAQADPTPRPEQPGEPPRRGTAVIPPEASVGARDLAAITPALRQGIVSQPFGKTFAELSPKSPAPKKAGGVGGTASHPDLSNDPIEVQAQVQYLEETKVEARYGHVSIRVVRVFRYGKLGAAQLVLERIGRDTASSAAFEADVAALAKAWKKPLPALGIDEQKFRVARSDLYPLSKDRPLRVVIEPEEDSAP